MIYCKCCRKKYVEFSTGFNEGFRIQKSDINTGNIRCEVTNHLLNACCSLAHVQLIENVSVLNDDDIDKVLWEREKRWQAQLFTLCYALNNPNEWYALNRRRGYRR